ncbi:MAG: nuclear transport factor 2 family protein [Leptolyngbyaceae cyanobacterium CSU_1_3]|nr:nuclear transport factor 2 family protein [Leptolyngbyaceae cyanobacterium CSU_1_3]
MSSSVEVVEKMYHCFKSGDMATLKAEVFAEDLKWHLPGHHPLAGTKHGIDEVLAFLGVYAAWACKLHRSAWVN